MKQKLTILVSVLVLLAAGGYVWHFLRTNSGEGPGGFPLVCPHCDHFFTLSEDELYTHPKGSAGEGFKCPQCGKFGARIAAKCDRCGQWVIMQQGADGTTRCPKCSPPAKP